MVEPTHYADELAVAATYELGTYRITHDEIVAFAQQWDPQYFHVDDQAAAAGRFGEVIASGIQTVAVFQRLAVLAVFREWHIIAGRSLRDVRFFSPVRPGMELRAQLTIDEIESSRPDRSLVTMTGTITHDESIAGETRTIMTMVFDVYVLRRP